MNKSQSKYFNTAVKMDKAFLELLNIKDFDYITVKEICERAGVNRSTFYLHYETISDLLAECVEYTNNQCFKRFNSRLTDMSDKISTMEIKNLNFITPAYLRPYLEFTFENKRLFETVVEHADVMQTEKTFMSLFNKIFSPVLDRFNIADDKKHYIIMFYISGITAVIKEWLKKDCKDPIDMIMDIIVDCILPSKLMKMSEPSNDENK